MPKIGKHGISENTPKNVLFGAGTYLKNIKFITEYAQTEDEAITADKKYYTRSGNEGSYIYSVVENPTAENISTYYEAVRGDWTGEILGATAGGGKLSFKGEFVDIELDGALVKVKGLTVKQGGTASMEVNYGELSPEILKTVAFYKESESDAIGFKMYEDKPTIDEGDYLESFGFIGKTANGAKTIVAIMENALCTSGLEIEAKDGSGSIVKATLEAYADLDDDSNLDTLPVKIYYPDDN